MLQALPLLAATAAVPAATPPPSPCPQAAPGVSQSCPDQAATDKDVAPPTITQPAAQPDTRPSGGKLKIGGAIRGRYDLRFNDVGASGQRRTSNHLSFDLVAITADYKSDRFFGSAQYRFLGGNFIYSKSAGYKDYPGEVNYLMYAYGGMHLSKTDDITIGVQPVPFDDRYWGSSLLDDLGFVYGMEETYNFGVKYSRTMPKYQLQIGLFPSSGPAGMGISRDAARYSTNVARADSYVPNGSQNDERDMVIGSFRYTLADASALKLDATGSAWFSTIHNFDTQKDGRKHMFAGSLTATRGAWHAKALVARQDIDPRNPGRNDMITVGGYDSSYNIAAKGTYVFGEVGKDLDTGKFPFNVELYLNYGKFMKDVSSFKPSERFDLGAFWTSKDHDRIKIYSEFLIGRNDPYVGSGQFISGAAQGGDNRYKASFFVVAGYYF
jgi:hypothetical protein